MRAGDAVGRYGEQVAVEHLLAFGWEVLDRNWRCRHGELDVVARDGRSLVFVEVKTRRSVVCGHPAEAVTPAKLVRLRQLAAAWLAAHGEHAPAVRIDVVAIVRPASGPALVDHLRGVA